MMPHSCGRLARMDAVLNHFYETMFWPLVLLFGGAWVALRLLRGLALRVLPDWLAGPGGLLIDTSGRRMGMFDRDWHRAGSHDAPWNRGAGPNDGDGRCD